MNLKSIFRHWIIGEETPKDIWDGPYPKRFYWSHHDHSRRMELDHYLVPRKDCLSREIKFMMRVGGVWYPTTPIFTYEEIMRKYEKGELVL
jgi:hypothetical protein